MPDTTTIGVTNRIKDDLDAAAKAIFGTDEVPYRVTIDRLLKDHNEVDRSDDEDSDEAEDGDTADDD
jgi:hypothetical protein